MDIKKNIIEKIESFNMIIQTYIFPLYQIIILVYIIGFSFIVYKKIEFIKIYYYGNKYFNFCYKSLIVLLKTLSIVLVNSICMYILLMNGYSNFDTLLFEHIDNYNVRQFEYKSYEGFPYDPNNPAPTLFYRQHRNLQKLPTMEEIKIRHDEYVKMLYGSEENFKNRIVPEKPEVDVNNLPRDYYKDRPEDHFDPENQYYVVRPFYDNTRHLFKFKFKTLKLLEYPVSYRFTKEPPVTLDYDRLANMIIRNNPDVDKDVYLYKIVGFNERAGRLIIEPVVYKKKIWIDMPLAWGKMDLCVLRLLKVTRYIKPLFEDNPDDPIIKAYGCETFEELVTKSCNGELGHLMERTQTTPYQQKCLKVWHPNHSILVLNDFYSKHMYNEIVNNPDENRGFFRGSNIPINYWGNLTKEAVEFTIRDILVMYGNVCLFTQFFFKQTIPIGPIIPVNGGLGNFISTYSIQLMKDDYFIYRHEGPFGIWMWTYGICLKYSSFRPYYENRGFYEAEWEVKAERNYLYNKILCEMPEWVETFNPGVKHLMWNVFDGAFFHTLTHLKTYTSEEMHDFERLKVYIGAQVQAYELAYNEVWVENGGYYRPKDYLPGWYLALITTEFAVLAIQFTGI